MKYIDANMFKNGIKNAVANLDVNKDLVNALNVFPVPDGDTGINMFLTIKSASEHALSEDSDSCGDIAKALSKGALMGARGNSGVILSQILRGLSQGIADKKTIDVSTMSHALTSAKEVAYKAVMKPTEGTILTVIREIAEYAEKSHRKFDDTVEFFKACLDVGQKSLDNTPNLLPVLKEAGVVDSGGKGLMVILEGFYFGFIGKEIDYEIAAPVTEPTINLEFDESIKYGYCTEFMIHTDFDDLDLLKHRLLDFGDSLVCVKNDDIIKIHVHTNHPGKAFEIGLEYGYITGVKADNMRLQNAEVRARHDDHIKEEMINPGDLEHKENAFIAVAAGEGIKNLFLDLGADKVVLGGQTMNPSVEDFIKAVDSINADNIFILPNNSNIILTAENVCDISDKNIIVIPTRTIPQGIQALINYDDSLDLNTITETMTKSLEEVKSGAITYAVRDTVIDGREIKKGDYMAIIEKDIVASDSDRYGVLKAAIESAVNEDTSIVTLFAGEEIDDATLEEDVANLSEAYPDIDIESARGDQPVYYYLLSIE
ncbi:DAK2 domain-containing protein [Ezakiella peruensis]|uniref:DAK2 domain-containing protein n=1 Tax=Ezakiella peruensis TaxID=1464038 RepID=UPI000C1B1FEE|nr:DAK2 domain-containing protein [Ezakiella peruensis]